jgi:hypothetical protein
MFKNIHRHIHLAASFIRLFHSKVLRKGASSLYGQLHGWQGLLPEEGVCPVQVVQDAQHAVALCELQVMIVVRLSRIIITAQKTHFSPRTDNSDIPPPFFFSKTGKFSPPLFYQELLQSMCSSDLTFT